MLANIGDRLPQRSNGNWIARQPTKRVSEWPEIQITVPVAKRTGSVTQPRCPSDEAASSNNPDNCPSVETVRVVQSPCTVSPQVHI
jgi:hypothetical protein